MADPTEAAGAAGHATWPDVVLWLLNHNAPSVGLIAALGALLLWKADVIITAVSGLVNGWRETSLKIREFEARKGDRVQTIAQEIRDEKDRVHISTGG